MYVFLGLKTGKLHGTSLAWRIHFSRRVANLSLGSLGSEKLPWTRWASLARRLTFEASQMPKVTLIDLWWHFFKNILWQHFKNGIWQKEWSKQPSTSVIYKTNIWNHWISLKSLSRFMIVFFVSSRLSPSKSRRGESPTDPARGRASRRVSWGWPFINVFPARLFTGEKLQTVYKFRSISLSVHMLMGKDMKSLHLFWSSKC